MDIFLTLDGSAAYGATATANTKPAYNLMPDGIVSVTSEATASPTPAYHLICSGNASVEADEPHLNWIRWITLVGDVIISAVDIWANRSVQTSDLQVDLAPGEEITVDAANYCVLKDGYDITFVHSGCWIDELTRETKTIAVQTDTGTVSVEIEYTEKYL